MEVPPDDSPPIQEHDRSSKRLVKVGAQSPKRLPIERPIPRKRHHERGPVRTTTGPTGSLEVVRFSGGDVGHEHSVQTPYVDAQLESGGRAQHVPYPEFEEVLETAVLPRRQLCAVLLAPQADLKDGRIPVFLALSPKSRIIV